MGIKMVGLDYEKLSLEEREIFSFTKEKTKEVMKEIKNSYPIDGCALIATCNRTELYFSSQQWTTSPYEMLCRGVCRNAAPGTLELLMEYRKKAVEREEGQAVSHLFQLACGMKSQIFGEDQIIAQVKDALLLARESKTTDVVLERLFQTAAAAAKKVKTKVRLTGVKTSVIENALNILSEHLPGLQDLPCLVIGNGEMGRLAASRLLEMGAKVIMTVRRYKTREVVIPVGCKIIDYKERYDYAGRVKVIFSATSSPHHTLLWEEGVNEEGKQTLFSDGESRFLFDLAMPRDISSEFGAMEQIHLYNIDSLGGVATQAINNDSVAAALEILKEYEEEFQIWYGFRGYVPVIQEIGAVCAKDIWKRIEKCVKKQVREEKTRAELESLVETAAGKVVGNLMYGMKEHLNPTEWHTYMETMEKIVMNE